MGAGAVATTSALLRVAGTLIEVDPNDFLRLMRDYRDDGPIVVHGVVGIFRKKHAYLTSIRGLIFYCESERALPLKADVEAKIIRLVR